MSNDLAAHVQLPDPAQLRRYLIGGRGTDVWLPLVKPDLAQAIRDWEAARTVGTDAAARLRHLAGEGAEEARAADAVAAREAAASGDFGYDPFAYRAEHARRLQAAALEAESLAEQAWEARTPVVLKALESDALLPLDAGTAKAATAALGKLAAVAEQLDLRAAWPEWVEALRVGRGEIPPPATNGPAAAALADLSELLQQFAQ